MVWTQTDETRRENAQRKITVVDFFPSAPAFMNKYENFLLLLPSHTERPRIYFHKSFLLRVLFFLASADTYKCPIFRRGLLKSQDTPVLGWHRLTVHYVTFSLVQASVACFLGKSLRDTSWGPSSHRQRPRNRSYPTRKSQFSFFFVRDAFEQLSVSLGWEFKSDWRARPVETWSESLISRFANVCMFQFFPCRSCCLFSSTDPAIDVVVFYVASVDGLVNGAFEDRQCMLMSDRDVSETDCLHFLLWNDHEE